MVLAALGLGACVSLVPYERAVSGLEQAQLLDLEGAAVHIERAGADTGGTPIVLVHGFGASTFSWRHVIPALAEHHPVVAVDLFGFGLSQRPREKSRYSRSGQVELLAALVDRLDLGSAHFVGHSYGGGLVMSLAYLHPGKVSSLTLVGSTAPDYPDKRRHALGVPPFANLFVHTLLRPHFVRRSLTRSFFNKDAVTPELVGAYLERVKIEGAVRAFVGLTRPARTDPRFTELSYERLAQPALLVWGAEDALIAPAAGRGAAEQLPNARFVEIPECGHLPMEEKPEQLIEAVLPFLAEVDALPANSRSAG